MSEPSLSEERLSAWQVVPFRTVTASGLKVHLRAVLPRDRAAIELGFQELSERTRRLRFLTAHKFLSDDELDAIVTHDGRSRFAIGVEIENEDSAPSPAGVARYVRSKEQPTEAEMGITIADAFHGLGLGTLLIGTLAKQAAWSGIDTFTSLVSRDNPGMVHILKQLDSTFEPPQDGETQARTPLHVSSKPYPDTPTGQRIKDAYNLTTLVQLEEK
ncbi:MAG: GNAT family N-acetyltransferase [Pseudomonadota bacterium]